MAHREHNNEQLQREIAQQEQVLGSLLERVLEAPLEPLRASLLALGERLTAATVTSAQRTDELQDLVTVMLEAVRQLPGRVKNVRDDLADFQAELHTLAAECVSRERAAIERHEGLLLAVTQLEAQHIAMREHSRVIAEQLNGALDDIARQAAGQHTQLQEGYKQGLTRLDALALQAETTRGVGADMTNGLARLKDELALLREQDEAAIQRQERHHVELGQRIDILPRTVDLLLERVAGVIEASTHQLVERESVRRETEQAMLVNVVEARLVEQFGLVRRRDRWMFLLCGLSLVTSAGLWAFLLMR